MLDVSRIRGICFDIDGTLSDTDDDFVRRLDKWLVPMRLVFPTWDSLAFARRIIMRTETPATFFHGLPDRFGIDGPISAFGDYLYRKGLGRSNAPFTLIPGVVEMLEKLSTHFQLGIVSARGERSVQLFLMQFNISGYFTSIASAQTCVRSKPDPCPVLWVAKQMDISPQDCLMVGDTTVDIRAGKLAGTQTVGVLCGFGEEKELVDAGADFIVETTPDLIRYIL